MTFDELVKVIASHRSEGKCIGECYDAIMGNLVWPVGGKFVTNGNWRASTALRILSIREGTTREGGIPTEGFETTLQNLASCAPDEKIEQYGLKAPDRVFALSLVESDHRLLGCIRVMLRLGDGLSVDRQHRQQCPCCGYYTLSRRGRYDTCPVCFWEDDNAMEVFGQPAPERQRSVSPVELWQARENFLAFGASEERCKNYVRPPQDGELP